MGKNEKTPIVINDKEYLVEDLTQEQQAMVNHISDLDRKLSSARFNLDQLKVGREAFVNMLNKVFGYTRRKSCIMKLEQVIGVIALGLLSWGSLQIYQINAKVLLMSYKVDENHKMIKPMWEDFLIRNSQVAKK